MPVPEFILRLRAKIGHDPLWLIGCTAVVVRPHGDDAATAADALAATRETGTAEAAGAPRVGRGLRAVEPVVWSAAADGAAAVDVLLVRRSDDGLWSPVTGVVDPGEHPANAAVRETLEETCVEAAVERLAQVHVTDEVVHANGDIAQYTGLVFRCRYVAGRPAAGDDESIDARWWPAESMPPMREVHRAAIRAALRDDPACELRDGDAVLPVG